MTSLDSYLNTNCIQTGKHCSMSSREKERENAKKRTAMKKKMTELKKNNEKEKCKKVEGDRF